MTIHFCGDHLVNPLNQQEISKVKNCLKLLEVNKSLYDFTVFSNARKITVDQELLSLIDTVLKHDDYIVNVQFDITAYDVLKNQLQLGFIHNGKWRVLNSSKVLKLITLLNKALINFN